MNLTIEKAMQQAVAEHNKGNLRDAERVYREVLKVVPAHVDANHNLGILYLSVNLSKQALPLLRTALEAHPEFEHFWVSYFHGLCYNRQFSEGRAILAAGKENGLSSDTVARLEEILFNALEEM